MTAEEGAVGMSPDDQEGNGRGQGEGRGREGKEARLGFGGTAVDAASSKGGVGRRHSDR